LRRKRIDLVERARRLVEMGIYESVEEALADLEQGVVVEEPDAVVDSPTMTVVAGTRAEAEALDMLARGRSSEYVARALGSRIFVECVSRALFRKRRMCRACFFKGLCLLWRDPRAAHRIALQSPRLAHNLALLLESEPELLRAIARQRR